MFSEYLVDEPVRIGQPATDLHSSKHHVNNISGYIVSKLLSLRSIFRVPLLDYVISFNALDKKVKFVYKFVFL
jgi:hypothetical protein